MTDGDTQPVVTPERLTAAANVVVCLEQGDELAYQAGEWAAGAIPQIEDPRFKALVTDLMIDYHEWNRRLRELRHLAQRRLETLKQPPRVTIGPMGGK